MNTDWLNQYFILRWNGWRQFIRDFVVIQIGSPLSSFSDQLNRMDVV